MMRGKPKNQMQIARRLVKRVHYYAKRYPRTMGSSISGDLDEIGRIKVHAEIVRGVIPDRAIADMLLSRNKRNADWIKTSRSVALYALRKFGRTDAVGASHYLEEMAANVLPLAGISKRISAGLVSGKKLGEPDRKILQTIITHRLNTDLNLLWQCLREASKYIKSGEVKLGSKPIEGKP